MSVDASAVIDPSADIAEGVTIGPYTVIGAKVEIDSGTWIGPHVVINGPTRIGKDNRIFQYASVGEVPQDKKFHGESSRLVIGDRNTIREFVTINRGTDEGGGITQIGNDNWLMAYIHIAHDCIIGNHTTFSNGASLAGHVYIDDYVTLGGFTLVHQFCSVGKYSFCGMGCAISKDVPPYLMIGGNPARPRGINIEGLKRHQFSTTSIRTLRNAYKTIYRSGYTAVEAIEALSAIEEDSDKVALLIDFIRQATRGIIR